MPHGPDRGVSRRAFVKSAVAIGGASALAACAERERALLGKETSASDERSYPRGSGRDALPSRQHAWNHALVDNAHGSTVGPAHQVVLGLSYEGSAPPSEAERAAVADAMASVERAFQWGTGGDPSAVINQGLLTMLGYAPRYFDAVGSDVELTRPEELLETLDEDPASADGHDAVLILNSDLGSVVLEAEAALFGERATANGVEMAGTLDGVFSRVERRTGVVGKGLPAERLDSDVVPESAPLSMGFRSGFTDNQAPEDEVTIAEGPFAGGTTLQVSRLEIDVEAWYEQDGDERVAEMFCPAHDTEDVGETGAKLGKSSGVTREDVERIPEDAETRGCLGHAQKVASARDDDFVPRILRRSEGVATDGDGVGFNFNSVQRDVEAFAATRRAMASDAYDVDVPAENHGIVSYLDTVARGTYVVPPRPLRALPAP